MLIPFQCLLELKFSHFLDLCDISDAKGAFIVTMFCGLPIYELIKQVCGLVGAGVDHQMAQKGWQVDRFAECKCILPGSVINR